MRSNWMLLPLALCLSLAGAPPKDGIELLQQMHDRYAGRWYRTMSFVQKTSYPDGRVETWYEAAEVPGKLRIDISPVDSGNTIIFRNDSVYQFQHRERLAARVCSG